MPVKKHSVEQIIAKLREIEKLTSQGMPIPTAAKKVGVTDQATWTLFVAQPSVRTQTLPGLPPRVRTGGSITPRTRSCSATLCPGSSAPTSANTRRSRRRDRLGRYAQVVDPWIIFIQEREAE